MLEVEILREASLPEHSWKRFAGMFEDEPLFDEVLEDIEARRREDDHASLFQRRHPCGA